MTTDAMAPNPLLPSAPLLPVPPVLSVDNVKKRFGSTRALNGVSFDLQRGEVLGVIGDNGAGKSTLVNVIAGVHRPDEGTIAVEGIAQHLGSPRDAQTAGIETVFQYLSLIPTLSITDNIFLNREMFGPGTLLRAARRVDRAGMRQKVEEAYDRLGLVLPAPDTKVVALSGGQRQAVAIARAVIWERKVVVLDEPTAALGVRQTEIVLSFIRRLREHGVSVIVITHNMEHVLAVSDRIVVLRLGRKVADVLTAGTSGRDLVEKMTGATQLTVDAGER
jgi:ABC-type sugar transport system ATPase subunit